MLILNSFVFRIVKLMAIFFPRPIYQKLKKLFYMIVRFWRLHWCINFINYKNNKKLLRLKGKSSVRVVFLVIHQSVWKVDSVFQKMLRDSFFEPVILVCPYISCDHKKMVEELSDTYEYFNKKGYPVYISLDQKNNRWLNLEDLSPDIIFFTNPHNLTRRQYYTDAFREYLSVYVPYYFMATTHAGNNYEMYGNPFLTSMYRVFWPSEYHLNQQLTITKGLVSNGTVTGYPAMEPFFGSFGGVDAWKTQGAKKKKIIFAPHHTIDENESSLSSFLKFADIIKTLSIKFSDQIQWSFKPHPMLKEKLLKHSEWGREKTELYYKFWESNPFTQLDEGEYVELFKGSDAIIHDCSSFICEYAFLEKPSLFLMSKKKAKSVVNPFGEIFLKQYIITESKDDVEEFLIGVLKGSHPVFPTSDLKDYIENYYLYNEPSDLVLKNLREALVN